MILTLAGPNPEGPKYPNVGPRPQELYLRFLVDAVLKPLRRLRVDIRQV